jgi:hypothetical protein
MPTDTGLARSNYFRVQDIAAFKKWADRRSLYVEEHLLYGNHCFAISRSEFASHKYFDSEPYDDWLLGYETDGDQNGADDFLDIYVIAEELSEYLAEGSVAVLLRVGSMKLQDITAYGVAINNAKDTEELYISQAILEKAESLGTEITHVRM